MKGKRAGPKQPKEQVIDPYTHSKVGVAPHTRRKNKRDVVPAAARGRGGRKRETGGLFAEERALEAKERILAEELTAAATRIQAIHRGRSARLEVSMLQDVGVDGAKLNETLRSTRSHVDENPFQISQTVSMSATQVSNSHLL